MPRAVRNFWIEVDAGHRSIATGPRRADEGIDVRIYVREDGSVAGPVRISGRVGSDGTLTLEALPMEGGSWVTLAQVAR